MPIYEYQCERCATVTDIKHGFKEPMTDACPKCAGHLKRLFNPASIVFKGSGFYVNDSRQAAGSNAKAEGSKSETGTGEPPKSEASKTEPKGEPSKSEGPKSEPSKSSSGPKSGSEAAA